MTINKERTYEVEAHPKGLGFWAVERVNGKVTWRSNNHADKTLCDTEINDRKARLKALNAHLDKPKKRTDSFRKYKGEKK